MKAVAKSTQLVAKHIAANSVKIVSEKGAARPGQSKKWPLQDQRDHQSLLHDHCKWKGWKSHICFV